MSISSVAASIAALRPQPAPAPAPARIAPSQPASPARKPEVITASAVAAKQGELLNKLI